MGFIYVSDIGLSSVWVERKHSKNIGTYWGLGRQIFIAGDTYHRSPSTLNGNSKVNNFVYK